MRWISICVFLALFVAGCDKSTPEKSDHASPLSPKPPSTPTPGAAAITPAATPAAPLAPAAAGTAQWQCAATTFDFGTVWAGSKLSHSFAFENTGSGTLKILKTIPKCGCSLAKEYPKELAPGAKGEFEFALNTTGKKERISENITVNTNDPARPDMLLVMTGVVNPVINHEIVADQSWVGAIISEAAKETLKNAGGAFGTIKADQKLRRTLKITNATGKPLTLSLEPVDPKVHFKVEFKEIKPQQEWELKIAADPPHPPGQYYTKIHLITNLPEVPIYEFIANANLAAMIEVVPPSLIFDAGFKGATTRHIIITNHKPTPFEVVSVATSDPGLDVSGMPPRSAKGEQQFVFQIVAPSVDYHPPPYGEMIRIQTTDAERPIIDVPVLPFWNRPAEPRPADHPMTFHAGRLASPFAGEAPGIPLHPTSQPAH